MSLGGAVRLSAIAILLRVAREASCTVAATKNYSADARSNITIPCDFSQMTNIENVMWVFHRKGDKEVLRHAINDDGSLTLSSLKMNDSGMYSCIGDVENNNNSVIIENVHLLVKGPPPPLVNVSTHLSTILGLIFWDVAGDGGYPIIDFTAEYRAALPPNKSDPTLEEWRPISPNHISPNARQIDVYHLLPNTSYWFRVWATNYLGTSVPVETLGHTLYSDVDKELARVFLTGVETFDTRIWVAAVAIVMGTLCILTVGTCLLLYRECRVPTDSDEEQDVMELVPNIILNPGFMDGQLRNEERSSDSPAVVIRSNGKFSKANGSAEPRKV